MILDSSVKLIDDVQQIAREYRCLQNTINSRNVRELRHVFELFGQPGSKHSRNETSRELETSKFPPRVTSGTQKHAITYQKEKIAQNRETLQFVFVFARFSRIWTFLFEPRQLISCFMLLYQLCTTLGTHFTINFGKTNTLVVV